MSSRPSELFGLERRDIDHEAGVVYARRAYANGRLKHTKTRLSNRAVPLQAKAVEALEGLPLSESEILFPNARTGRIDFRSFGRRHWKPAQQAAGIEPLRDLYDLRHTYATFALRAGVPVFAVSRFMGSSITMIDHHYGHLAHDSRQHAVSLLDALALERAVDAAWTSACALPKPVAISDSRPRRRRSRQRVDARWTSQPRNRRQTRRQKELISRNFSKPSDGLEPSTPSLPSRSRIVDREVNRITREAARPDDDEWEPLA